MRTRAGILPQCKHTDHGTGIFGSVKTFTHSLTNKPSFWYYLSKLYLIFTEKELPKQEVPESGPEGKVLGYSYFFCIDELNLYGKMTPY